MGAVGVHGGAVDADVVPLGPPIEVPPDGRQGVSAQSVMSSSMPPSSLATIVMQLPPVLYNQNLVPKRSPRAVQMAV